MTIAVENLKQGDVLTNMEGMSEFIAVTGNNSLLLRINPPKNDVPEFDTIPFSMITSFYSWKRDGVELLEQEPEIELVKCFELYIENSEIVFKNVTTKFTQDDWPIGRTSKISGEYYVFVGYSDHDNISAKIQVQPFRFVNLDETKDVKNDIFILYKYAKFVHISQFKEAEITIEPKNSYGSNSEVIKHFPSKEADK